MPTKMGVTCPVCKKGEIVGQVQYHPRGSLPFGPGSSNPSLYRHTATFFCEECRTVFQGVPGKPNAASELIDAAVAEQRNRYHERLNNGH